MMEIDLGTRPHDERAFAAPGEQYYRELATIEAQAYRRMLDRVFWHPPADVLRFEIRAVPTGDGTQYTVTAILDGIGEAWFDKDSIPARWDAIATYEVSWSLTEFQAAIHDVEVVSFEKPGGKPGNERMPDYASIQDPAEAARYRWNVVNRLRKAGIELK
ncbi:hypothetical protein QO239_09925 [Cupriavidus taiwanensis]|uniref:hypothetical protein n=1 Tax=Cupriavidus taiwanensis TaxID=164546 RepID=UPI0025415394|nr:hypothetical protein [Cupriavidus taiwanensis]MDK3022908.1 hypothetical protein [Cupriavidus taiwanensis]